MAHHTIKVKGMHCKSCTMLVNDALSELGASNISIKLDEKTQEAVVSFDYAGDKKQVIAAIEKEGYKV